MQTNVIANRAVLAQLNINCFASSKTDKRITKETNERNGVGAGAGRYVKVILESKTLDIIDGVCREVRDCPQCPHSVMGQSHRAAAVNHVR